jgi:hypothetical protein
MADVRRTGETTVAVWLETAPSSASHFVAASVNEAQQQQQQPGNVSAGRQRHKMRQKFTSRLNEHDADGFLRNARHG